MTHKHQEYPKWQYHPRHGGKIFQSADENKWSWLFGWRDTPYPPKEKQLIGRIKISWLEWKWFIEAIGAILVITVALFQLFSSSS